MSNTRRASGDGPLRQERFASSQEFERGLMANLVAKRCTLLERQTDRELIWFLQLLSHSAGGLAKVASDLLANYPERIGTAAMQEFGIKPGRFYSADQVKRVRDEVPDGNREFPLKGEIGDFDSACILLMDTPEVEQRKMREAAIRHPTSYPAGAFVSKCRDAAEAELEKYLAQLCLDPGARVRDGERWYFAALITTLREYLAEWIAARKPAATTSLGTQVWRGDGLRTGEPQPGLDRW